MQTLLLAASLFIAVASGAAEATSSSTPSTIAPSTTPAAKLDSTAAATDELTTGTLGTPKTRAQKLQDCMAIWEPATHMTKAQWKRTCDRQLDEEPKP